MNYLRCFVLINCLLLAASGLPSDSSAGEEDVLTEFGCTVEPRVPTIYGREIHSPVRLECETSLEGRLIVTELQQRRADGSYQNVPGTRLMFEADEPVMDEETIMEHSAFGWRVECRAIDGLQEFRTAVKIRAEKESTTRTNSESVALPQDCLGDEFEPVLSEADAQLALACQIAPLSDDAIADNLK